ncbi:MAG TPA: di-heme oxidoredictase family protein [Isosphaeraceae bacterium]
MEVRALRRSWLVSGIGLAGVVLIIGGRSGLGGNPPSGHVGLGGPFAGLTAAQAVRFNAGKAQFLSVEDLAVGLGPVFNDVSCVACHNSGASGGAGTRLVTRFGRLVGGVYDPMVELGGPLIQSQGIGLVNGVNFVAEVVPATATIVAHRRTSPLFGLGLIDTIPDHAIADLADEEANRDPATAGAISPVADIANPSHSVGRFGWKAQHATLFAFAGDAYTNELGVTTPILPDENCPQGNCALLAANPALTNPNDLDNSAIQTLADFITFLAPPPRGPVGRTEQAGEALFASIGCAACHRPTWQSGASPVPALNNVRFSPYSDFLLHDMGSLGDGITQNEAGPTMMRTAPLWGLRFQTSLLHDGRAATPQVAILQHDGQGLAARNRFARLRPQQRDQLIAFLNSI